MGVRIYFVKKSNINVSYISVLQQLFLWVSNKIELHRIWILILDNYNIRNFKEYKWQ